MVVLHHKAETCIFPVLVGATTILAATILYNLWRNGWFMKKSNRSIRKSTVLKTLVDSNEKYILPLVEKEEISHDTRLFRFGLPSREHVLGLPVGLHIHLLATINDEIVVRPYTPISSDDDLGYADLIIKVYRKGVHPKYPDGGKMTQHLDSLNIGDFIAVRGPSGRLQYFGNGKFALKKLRKDPPRIIKVEKVNMIAGGTGITPMLQLIREVLKHSDTDKTCLSLLYANQSESDILLRSELDQLAFDHPQQFKVWYTLDKAPEGWIYSEGFVNEEMFKEHLFDPGNETVTLLCGPPPMVNFACHPTLEKMGYQADLRFAY